MLVTMNHKVVQTLGYVLIALMMGCGITPEYASVAVSNPAPTSNIAGRGS